MDIVSRKKILADRIKKERKLNFRTQELFAERLGEELRYTSEEHIAQNTVSNWENGQSVPELDKLLAMSKIFGCDVGYLLGDYDERTASARDISNAIGLSEATVEALSFLKTWNFGNDITPVIDKLVFDYHHTHKNDIHQPLLQLIALFLNYTGTSSDAAITTSGKIIDNPSGGFSSNWVKLDSHVIENAILMEITRALISLKSNKNKAGA